VPLARDLLGSREPIGRSVSLMGSPPTRQQKSMLHVLGLVDCLFEVKNIRACVLVF